ncbi:MAG: serine/threonine protein kinase [Gammaproteobacteria bacterium]|jgi:serine/threonine protein kinase
MEIQGYTIQREIGKGGMATVYLAVQESLHRNVVLKILDDVKMATSEDLAERFLAEGRIIASLKHPNIITIYDIGIANDLLYISMEYVQGGDLKQRLELPITPDESLDYLCKIANALGEAHKHGIVHRDVKPANILFSDNDTPLLTDFGIAKEVDVENDLTLTGIFLGSPNYVSPEQADGEKIDGRTDIYSLGCIFYEMLTGSKPYISTSVIDIVIQHKQGPVPMLPDELSEFQPLLNRMMAKKRGDRFAEAGDLITAIESLQSKRSKMTTITDFDITGFGAANDDEIRKKRASKILMGLLLLGMVMFSSLKYIEIKIKSEPSKNAQSSTSTVLDEMPLIIPTVNVVPVEDIKTDEVNTSTGIEQPTPDAKITPPPVTKPEPVSADVLKALDWLGKQSLEEYKLTYPAKDNAYYYFSRMLEMDPGNQQAISGILEISNRYAQQAEQALAKNQHDKMLTYIEYGLRINPRNEALLTLKSLAGSQDTSLLGTLKSFFTN